MITLSTSHREAERRYFITGVFRSNMVNVEPKRRFWLQRGTTTQTIRTLRYADPWIRSENLRFPCNKNKIDNFSGTRYFSHQNRYTNVNFIAVHHEANS